VGLYANTRENWARDNSEGLPAAGNCGARLQSLCDNYNLLSWREFIYAARPKKVVIPNEVRDLRFAERLYVCTSVNAAKLLRLLAAERLFFRVVTHTLQLGNFVFAFVSQPRGFKSLTAV
jgi:hypothetical protein